MNSVRPLSIGNDLVDLRTSEPPLHARYMSRVFTAQEQEAIGDGLPMLWLHWAAKEAAYKAFKRIDSTLSFVPLRLEFSKDSTCVRAPSGVAHCRWFINEEFLYVVCATDRQIVASSAIKNWVGQLQSEDTLEESATMSVASRLVRELACQGAAKELGVPQDSLSIKSGGVPEQVSGQSGEQKGAAPQLFVNERRSNHLLSFSHHGRFAICSFLEQTAGKAPSTRASEAFSPNAP